MNTFMNQWRDVKRRDVKTDGVMRRADDGGLDDVQGFILNVTISTNADGFVV